MKKIIKNSGARGLTGEKQFLYMEDTITFLLIVIVDLQTGIYRISGIPHDIFNKVDYHNRLAGMLL